MRPLAVLVAAVVAWLVIIGCVATIAAQLAERTP